MRSHTNEKHRSAERVESLVNEALELLGGINQFVKPGSTVLIKPNQTVYYSAGEGCTTDPLVVGALIRIVKRAGAARVQIAESSGGFFSSLQCSLVKHVVPEAGVARNAEAKCGLERVLGTRIERSGRRGLHGVRARRGDVGEGN